MLLVMMLWDLDAVRLGLRHPMVQGFPAWTWRTLLNTDQFFLFLYKHIENQFAQRQRLHPSTPLC